MGSDLLRGGLDPDLDMEHKFRIFSDFTELTVGESFCVSGTGYENYALISTSYTSTALTKNSNQFLFTMLFNRK